MDGKTNGCNNNRIDDFYAIYCATGIVMDSKGFPKSWCNWNSIRGVLQSCGIGVDLIAASTSRLDVSTKDSSITGIRCQGRSDYNYIILRSENDACSVTLEPGALKNILVGNIHDAKDSGTATNWLTSDVCDFNMYGPALRFQKPDGKANLIMPAEGNPANLTLGIRPDGGQFQPMISMSNSTAGPVTVFAKDARFDGSWDGSHIRLGPHHLWVDSNGALRIKRGAPKSGQDGTICSGGDNGLVSGIISAGGAPVFASPEPPEFPYSPGSEGEVRYGEGPSMFICMSSVEGKRWARFSGSFAW
jgi:hypothetical protein